MNLNNLNPTSSVLNHAKILTLGEPRNPNLASAIEQQGFKVELVQGIDARQLGRADLEGFADTDFLEAIREGLSDGEIACSVGHRKIYEKILSQDLDLALVIEDDAMPVEPITDFFTELRKTNLKEPSVFSLFFAQQQSPVFFSSKLKLGETEATRILAPPRSTVAYIINRTACEILLSTPRVVGRSDWPITANLISFYKVEPMPFRESAEDSYINEDRGSRRIGSSLPEHLPEVLHSLKQVFEEIRPKRLYLVRSVLGSWRLVWTHYFFPQLLQHIFLLWRKLREWKNSTRRRRGKE